MGNILQTTSSNSYSYENPYIWINVTEIYW